MKAVTAEFVRSAAAPGDFPADRLPEVALVGRSNVGKSSLINALVRRRVARISAKPGLTRLANFYRVRSATARTFYLVDLPGFGYAPGGGAGRDEFARVTAGYFSNPDKGAARPAIAGLVFLVDSRHPALASDQAAHRWILSLGIPFAVAATKIDKLPRAERARAISTLTDLFETPVLGTSAETGEGMNQLWKHLLTWTNRP